MKRLIFILILLALILSGIERYTAMLLKRPHPERTILTIAHGSEIAPLFRTLGSPFERIIRVAPVNNRIPIIRNITAHPMIMAKGADITDGVVDVWISPHQEFVHSRTLADPAAKFEECVPVFEGSLGIISGSQHLTTVGQFSSLREVKPFMEIHTLHLADPITSSSGWSAYSELQMIEANESFPVAEYLSRTRKISPSEDSLLQHLSDDASAFTIAGKNHFIAAETANLHLRFVPVIHPLCAPTYLFCTRNDLSPEVKQLSELLLTYLQTPHARDFILSAGFSPPSKLQQSHPSTCSRLLENTTRWKERLPPDHFVYIVDTSASIGKRNLATILNAIRLRFAHSPENQASSLITFDTETVVRQSLSRDKRELIATLNTLTTGGGSAVYDALHKAISLIQNSEAEKFRNHIILITDGEDSNSDTSLFSLINRYATAYQHLAFTLDIVAIKTHAPIRFNDLKEIAHTVQGSVLETAPEYLQTALSSLPLNQ